jgi:hypothetical protein
VEPQDGRGAAAESRGKRHHAAARATSGNQRRHVSGTRGMPADRRQFNRPRATVASSPLDLDEQTLSDLAGRSVQGHFRTQGTAANRRLFDYRSPRRRRRHDTHDSDADS